MYKFRNWVSRASPPWGKRAKVKCSPASADDGREGESDERSRNTKRVHTIGGERKEGREKERERNYPKTRYLDWTPWGCALVVVVEAKGHPHEVLMSGSLNQPPLASISLSTHRHQPPSSTEAPRRGKNFLGIGCGWRSCRCPALFTMSFLRSSTPHPLLVPDCRL